MNQYSQLLYFLKQLAEAHPMVNTVTKGLAQNIDLEKANIFPLVHITIDEAGFKNGQTIGFNVTLECLTERQLNPKVVDNKFWRQDNEVDNHNETLAILNYMWTSIFRDWNNNDMTTSDEPTLTKIEFAKGNILDGWAMTFEVEVPNTALTLCDITFDDIEAVISAGTGGNVLPGVGTFALTYGSNNAYYAEPSSGYRFLKWLYNGFESLVNPIAIKALQSFTLVANFIKQWLVTTSVNGAGTITPSSGLKDEGNITIEVTVTDPLNDEFEKIEITPDGEVTQTFLTNPLTWALNKAVVIVGYVKAKITTIMDVFSTIPIQQGDDWIFPDSSDFASNVIIKNVRCATFPESSITVDSNYYLLGQTQIDIDIIFKLNSTAFSYLIGGRASSGNAKGLLLFTSGGILNLVIGNGSTSQTITSITLSYNTKYRILLSWNGLINGIITLTINDIIYTYTALKEWTGNSGSKCLISYGAGGIFVGKYYYASVLNGATDFEYVFNHGQGVVMYNLRGALNGTISSNALWRGNDSQIEPYDYTKGATLYLCPPVNLLSGEMVVNSTFDTTDTSYWNAGFTGVTISGNGLAVVNYSGSSVSLMRRNGVFTTGLFYKVIIEVSTFTSGKIDVYCAGVLVGVLINAGNYVFYVIGAGTNAVILSSSAAVLDIDTISIMRIDALSTGIDGTVLPICFNTSQSITGFNRIGWFPAGSGALKSLPNTYYVSGIDEVIPDGEYTIDQLIAYESDKCIVTQDDNIVSRFEVIGKAPYTSPLQGTEEEYIIIEEDNINKYLTSED